MSIIDLKIKTYDELTFEITRLNTDKYLLEQKLQQKENIIKEVREKTKENQEYLENAKEMYMNQNNGILKTHTLQLINNNLSQNNKLLEILYKGE